MVRETMTLAVGLMLLTDGLPAEGKPQQAAPPPGKAASEVECGLVAPDFQMPLRIFSPDYYRTQKTACLADRMTFYKVPGVEISVIDGGQIAWTKTYGVLEAGTARAVTDRSVFEAASVTKILTTVIVLRLVERGTLDLDRDVSEYLKAWKVPVGPLTATQPVTLRLLLSHRAGVNRPAGGLPFDDDHVPTLAQVLAGAPPATNEGVVVERVPGAGHQYSNLGFLIVQAVLEDATGQSFDALARDLVFGPLGMESSTLTHPLTGEWRSRWAVPHDENGVAHARNQLPGAVAHGGLVTTSADLARLAIEISRAYQGQSTRLLTRRSAELMVSKAADLDPRQFGAPVGHGLGVLLVGQGDTLFFALPGGNDPGANCWVIASPATGNGAVIMTNSAGGEALMLELLASIAHQYRWPDLAAR